MKQDKDVTEEGQYCKVVSGFPQYKVVSGLLEQYKVVTDEGQYWKDLNYQFKILHYIKG